VNARFLQFLALTTLGSSALLADPPPATSFLLRPAAVFDGREMHAGWAVLVQGDKISAAGPTADISAGKRKRSTCLTTLSFPG